MAKKINQRIGEIGAAVNVETLVSGHIGRCHPLLGDRYGQYAMDLCHPYRLVFEIIIRSDSDDPKGNDTDGSNSDGNNPDGSNSDGNNPNGNKPKDMIVEVQIANIQEIVDYH